MKFNLFRFSPQKTDAYRPHSCIVYHVLLLINEGEGAGPNVLCFTTFCISFLPSASPTIIDDRHARDANIARTLEGQTESEVSSL